MRKPDFIGIGAMKGATTWAWHQLREHPEIQMPRQKELHYFDNLICTPEYYLSQFAHLKQNFITGEITPGYLTVPHAPLLARRLCPKAKIFVILRNPVDRAFSHWKVAVWAEAKIPLGTTFREAFDFGHPHGLHWHSLKEKGMYFKYLQRWYSAFPKEQIKIFWYDDLLESPKKFIKELYDWIGVDNTFLHPNYMMKKNENWSRRTPVLKPEDREYMCSVYLPSIERLEKLTGRDLSSWKSP